MLCYEKEFQVEGIRLTTILDKKIKTIPPLPRFHAKMARFGWSASSSLIRGGGEGGGGNISHFILSNCSYSRFF